MELGFEFHRFFDLMRYAANATPGLGPDYVGGLINRDGVSGFSYTKDYPFPRSLKENETDIDKALKEIKIFTSLILKIK